MPTSYSTLLGLALPVTGELSGTWGDEVNNYITQYLDSAVAGTQTISGSQTAVTLSRTTNAALSQAGSGSTGSSQYQVINCTGNPASALTVTVPSTSKVYLVLNNTSTNQSVVVKPSAAAGVTVSAARAALIAWNGTDFELVGTDDASRLNGVLAAANGGTGQSSYTVGDILFASGSTTLSKLADVATGNALISGGVGVAPSYGKIGLTTHVSGTLPVANGGTGLTGGTSGGVLYYSAAGTLASSGALAASSLVVGGGAGVAPSTITTGTGVVTALGVNTGTAGAFVVNGGALGTPSSGTVTNLTGTASININGTVGATTANTGAFTSITSTSASGILTRAAATQDGVELIGRAGGTTSLKATITPTTLTASRTFTLPDNSGTVLTTGATVTVAQGGTGQTSYTNGQLLIGNTTGNTLAKSTLTAGSGVTITNGAGTITISATGSGGTVTGVTATSPVASSGGTAPVISLNSAYGDTLNPYGSKTANFFLAAPNGSAGAPTFRAVVAADIPTLNQNTTGTASNVTGTVAVANGGTGATTAANARTNLGGTTVGANLFTLTNPSAVTFPRFNADNTVSALDAATFRSAIGAGTGNGSVTSVGGTGTVNGITLTGTVTSTGNLTLGGTLSGVSLTTQVTGTLPIANGGTGTTSTQFVNLASNVTGTLPVANGGTGVTSSTGSGSVVLSTSPSLTTPSLGTPSSGNLTNTTVDGTNKVGYRNLPPVGTKTGSYTLAVGDVGKYVQVSTGGSITIPTSTFAEGDAITLFNNTTGNITITCSAPTAYIAGTNTVKTSMTLATRGVATILFISATLCVVTGNVT
jgi:hypothetical protein